MKIDAFKDQTFTGEISAINPEGRCLQAATSRSARRSKNADHKLLPGMYATVDIATGAPQNYVTLPQTAITYNPYGDTVYIVDSKGNGRRRQAAAGRAADLRHHRPDARRSGRRAQGRQRRRRVVTAGQIKLHNGSPVLIDNSITPTADAAPNVPLDR